MCIQFQGALCTRQVPVLGRRLLCGLQVKNFCCRMHTKVTLSFVNLFSLFLLLEGLLCHLRADASLKTPPLLSVLLSPLNLRACSLPWALEAPRGLEAAVGLCESGGTGVLLGSGGTAAFHRFAGKLHSSVDTHGWSFSNVRKTKPAAPFSVG